GEGHARHADAYTPSAHVAPDLPVAAKDPAPADARKARLGSYPGSVLSAADSPGRRGAPAELLASAGLQPEAPPDFTTFRRSLFPVPRSRFCIAVAPLEDGFAIEAPAIAVLTERQLFPERAL